MLWSISPICVGTRKRTPYPSINLFSRNRRSLSINGDEFSFFGENHAAAKRPVKEHTLKSPPCRSVIAEMRIMRVKDTLVFQVWAFNMRILLAKVVVAVPNGSLTTIGGREAQTFGEQVCLPTWCHRNMTFQFFTKKLTIFNPLSKKNPS